MNGRHPLPWSLPDRDNAVQLVPDSAFHDGEPKPYKIRLAPFGDGPGTTVYSASFTEAELRTLRDQIDAVLAAPYHILILGGDGLEDHPGVETALRARLDVLHSYHPRMEVATRGLPGVDEVAARWCLDADVPVLLYMDAQAMVAYGGNRALIVRFGGDMDGPNWEEIVLASKAGLCVDWVTLLPVEAVAS